MSIVVNTEGTSIIAKLSGRLDTETSPAAEAELVPKLTGAESLTLDITDLEYMSSAGLRVLLLCQKKMNEAGGKMVVRNPNELISEVFEATGFTDILTIE